MSKSVSVEIYSDVICPWCLIGHNRLRQALASLHDIEVDLTWLPFELNPDMPEEGMDRRAYLEGKFGPDRAKEVYGHIAGVLAAEGLDADVSKIKRTPNTFKAHRLIYLARAHGDSSKKLKLALFDAYFRDGLDIGADAVLLDCAQKAGLDRRTAGEWLTSDAASVEVRQLETRARQLGVQGVPFFILAGKYGVSGAQPADVLAKAIAQAAQA